MVFEVRQRLESPLGLCLSGVSYLPLRMGPAFQAGGWQDLRVASPPMGGATCSLHRKPSVLQAWNALKGPILPETVG